MVKYIGVSQLKLFLLELVLGIKIIGLLILLEIIEFELGIKIILAEYPLLLKLKISIKIAQTHEVYHWMMLIVMG